MSDVFGSLIKQYSLKQDASHADWLIGAGLLAAGVKGVALRSMKAPGTAYNDPVLGRDPQPAHMKDYIHTTDDNGGVHLNSGIPNHAFYLAAIAIGGNAWDVAGRIWYETLRDPKLKANANFAAFRETDGQDRRAALQGEGQGSDCRHAGVEGGGGSVIGLPAWRWSSGASTVGGSRPWGYRLKMQYFPTAGHPWSGVVA